ncbi:hypothetical protein [Hyalangium versicolor]|uniref:hypothetical protein n=1 Tax=Hyalangium versicolor TaxID=2861190 RepID=UPI001CCCE70D|nr:hypothetical protein [Hyalangium versicolor]
MNIQRTGSTLTPSLSQSTQKQTVAQSPAHIEASVLQSILSKVADAFEPQAKTLTSPGFRQGEDVPGAYYRKVVSGSSDQNQSISATVTLPRFQADPNRMFDNGELAQTGPLDKPSVYLGSHASTKIDKTKVEAEADIGLQWTRRFDKNGFPTFVSPEVQNSGKPPTNEQLYSLGKDNVLRNQKGEEFKGDAKKMVPHFAFTPFARVDEPLLDAKGKPTVDAKTGKLQKKNEYLQLDQRTEQSRYFYAGEKVHMSVERTPGSTKDNVTFSVQREGQAAKKYPFTSNVLGRNEASVSLKRVASIDQFTVQTENGVKKRVGVESTQAKQVEATAASLSGMTWERVEVKDRKGKSQPMTGKNFTQLYGRDAKQQPVNEAKTFHVSGYTSAGGERMDITPTLGSKR